MTRAGTRVMIVDEDEALVKATSGLLEERGYVVSTHSSVLGTAGVILRDRPDIVMCDVRSPGLDGSEIVRFARNVSPRVGFVLFSALDADVLEILVEKCGAAGWIRKTDEPSDVAARFDAIVDEHLSHRPTVVPPLGARDQGAP